MKKPLIPVAALAAAATGVVSLADPVSFPESGKYSADFESEPGEEWTLEAWLWEFIPEMGVEEMTGTGNGDGQVRPSSGGLDDFEFAEEGAEFPLEPKVKPGSYKTLGFSGENWLVSAGVGNATENDEGTFVQENFGTAKVEFKDLPEHKSVSIAMKIGVGGSIDAGNNGNRDGNFDVVVDGEVVFSHLFNSSGNNLDGVQGASTLAVNQNLTTLYREQWNDNGGAGPRDADDRFNLNWVMDSAYDIATMPSLTAIPHSADTLTVEFIQRMSSNANDEHIAIDDVEITLGSVDAPSPNKWPGGDTYTQDFSSVGGEWNIGTEWSIRAVETGRAKMTQSGGNAGEIRLSAHPDGFDESSFADGEEVFPLDPLVDPMNYSDVDARFEGTWLSSNTSAGMNGTATLHFTDLPPHDGIDVDFVLAAFDSIDGSDAIPDAEFNGNFQMVVDGEVVHEARFNGRALTGGDFTEGIEELIGSANLTQNYREQWNDSGDGPLDAEDRNSVNWTLDSAWDYGAFFDEGSETAIAHTSDTLTLSFVHGLSQAPNDEGIAVDAFQLKLLNASPDVPFAITSISRVAGSRDVMLTWNSRSAKTYGIDRSTNLVDWEEVNDGVESEGTSTTYIDNTVSPETREAYYRVREE